MLISIPLDDFEHYDQTNLLTTTTGVLNSGHIGVTDTFSLSTPNASYTQ